MEELLWHLENDGKSVARDRLAETDGELVDKALANWRELQMEGVEAGHHVFLPARMMGGCMREIERMRQDCDALLGTLDATRERNEALRAGRRGDRRTIRFLAVMATVFAVAAAMMLAR